MAAAADRKPHCVRTRSRPACSDAQWQLGACTCLQCLLAEVEDRLAKLRSKLRARVGEAGGLAALGLGMVEKADLAPAAVRVLAAHRAVAVGVQARLEDAVRVRALVARRTETLVPAAASGGAVSTPRRCQVDGPRTTQLVESCAQGRRRREAARQRSRPSGKGDVLGTGAAPLRVRASASAHL